MTEREVNEWLERAVQVDVPLAEPVTAQMPHAPLSVDDVRRLMERGQLDAYYERIRRLA